MLKRPDWSETPSRRSGIKRSCDADCQPLAAELRQHGAEEHLARRMAVRFWNAFQERAPLVFRQFLEHGWTVLEINEMQSKDDATWRKNAAALFEAEARLIQEGLESEFVRRYVIRYAKCADFDPEAVRAAIATYRELGFDDAALRRIFSHYPRAMIAPPDLIRAWRLTNPSGTNPLAGAAILNRKLRDPSEKPPDHADQEADEDEQAHGADEEDPDENEAFVSRNWQRVLPHLCRIVIPETHVDGALGVLKMHPWITDGTSKATAILDEVARWIQLPQTGRLRSDTRGLKLVVRLCVDERLHPFLRLQLEQATYRIAVIRRFILPEGEDLHAAPGLLLQEWERHRPEEYRYRTNVLADRDLPPHHQKILPLLLLRTRAEFDASASKLIREPNH